MTPAVPISQYDPGFINSVVHSLTGAQCLFYMFHAWSTNPSLPIIFWCKRGDGEGKINAIRVALAKERKARNVPRTFELRFSEPWPDTHLGVKGEAIKVERVSGSLHTQMSAAFHKLVQGGIK